MLCALAVEQWENVNWSRHCDVYTAPAIVCVWREIKNPALPLWQQGKPNPLTDHTVLSDGLCKPIGAKHEGAPTRLVILAGAGKGARNFTGKMTF